MAGEEKYFLFAVDEEGLEPEYTFLGSYTSKRQLAKEAAGVLGERDGYRPHQLVAFKRLGFDVSIRVKITDE